MIIFDLMKLLSLSLTLFSMEFVTQIGTYHNKSNCAEFMIDVCHFNLINCVLFCFVLFYVVSLKSPKFQNFLLFELSRMYFNSVDVVESFFILIRSTFIHQKSSIGMNANEFFNFNFLFNFWATSKPRIAANFSFKINDRWAVRDYNFLSCSWLLNCLLLEANIWYEWDLTVKRSK